MNFVKYPTTFLTKKRGPGETDSGAMGWDGVDNDEMTDQSHAGSVVLDRPGAVVGDEVVREADGLLPRLAPDDLPLGMPIHPADADPTVVPGDAGPGNMLPETVDVARPLRTGGGEPRGGNGGRGAALGVYVGPSDGGCRYLQRRKPQLAGARVDPRLAGCSGAFLHIGTVGADPGIGYVPEAAVPKRFEGHRIRIAGTDEDIVALYVGLDDLECVSAVVVDVSPGVVLNQAARGGLVIVLCVHEGRQHYLLDVGQADCRLRLLACLREHREEDGCQDRDDRDHHQQFDERETLASGSHFGHLL